MPIRSLQRARYRVPECLQARLWLRLALCSAPCTLVRLPPWSNAVNDFLARLRLRAASQGLLDVRARSRGPASEQAARGGANRQLAAIRPGSAPRGEEAAQQLAAFLGEYAGHDLERVVQVRSRMEMEVRIERARLRVRRAVDHLVHARLDQRTDAHDTRLDG